MNILILNWRDPKNPRSGGAEYVTMQHAKAWVQAKHNVTWFTSAFYGAKKEEKIDGVKIVRQGSPFTVHLHAVRYYLFSKNMFDIVIDEIHGIPFFTPLYVKKSKIIAFIHEVAGEIWDYMYPFPINIVGKFLENFYFQFYRSIQFWTDAPSTIDDLVDKGIIRKNCIAIPCPISNVIIKELPRKEKFPTYIFVSRLVKMKGIETIMEAFSIISQTQKDAQLWLVGGGEEGYIQHLEKLSSKLGISQNTTFWGRVTEKKKLELMRKAHVLLHASVKEGWGLVVLEAASQGTPAIVYRVAGLVDSVKDGKTGIIVKANTPNSLAEAAIALIKNNEMYKKMEQAGLSWVKSLTWGKVTKQSLSLLTNN